MLLVLGVERLIGWAGWWGVLVVVDWNGGWSTGCAMQGRDLGLKGDGWDVGRCGA